MSITHTIAIVKGTVEGDPEKHFAALGGIDYHVASAHELGFVVGVWPDVVATDAGRALYVAGRFADLPDGRANNWCRCAAYEVAVAAVRAVALGVE